MPTARRATRARPRLTVVYDPGCSFCCACARMLRRLDRGCRLVFARADTELAIGGVTLSPPELLSELHTVTAEGQVHGGFDACRRIAREVPALWPLRLVASLPGASRAGSAAYAWVARHRPSVPERWGSPLPERLPPG